MKTNQPKPPTDEEVEKLREDIKPYVRHAEGCPRSKWQISMVKCTCGLSALLRRLSALLRKEGE